MWHCVEFPGGARLYRFSGRCIGRVLGLGILGVSFFMFNICSWNVRSLNDPGKKGLVKYVLSTSKNVVYCLQKTKVDSISYSFLRSFAGPLVDKCHFVKALGASGGIVTCWGSRDFTCPEVLVRRFSITVRLKSNACGSSFYLTNVYGPPAWDGKVELCHELAELKGASRGLWIMCGDFNFNKCQQERKGSSWSGKLMAIFADLLNKL